MVIDISYIMENRILKIVEKLKSIKEKQPEKIIITILNKVNK